MKPSWSAAEIAETLNVTPRTIQRRAAKDGWYGLETPGRGGKVTRYMTGLLPENIRLELASACAAASVPKPCTASEAAGAECAARILASNAEAAEKARIQREKNLAEFNALPEKTKRLAEARFEVIRSFQAFTAASKLPKRKAATLFCREFRAGNIKLGEPVLSLFRKNGQLKISRASLDRWAAAYKAKWLLGLANGYAATAKTTVTGDHQAFIEALIYKSTHASHAMIYEAMTAHFKGDVPGESAVRRWTNRFKAKEKSLLLRISNPDKWKNKHMLAFGDASAAVTRLNQLWELDSTPADLMLTDGRYSLIGCLDVYSRRLGLLVSPTSNSKAVAGIIRRCIIDWGMPEAVKTDNGKDYISKHIVRVLDGLEVEQQLCEPFKGEQKPHVERSFKTFAHGIVELLPGFIGHNVAERKALEARRTFAQRIMGQGEPIKIELSSEDLQTLCNRWLETVYHEKKHGSTGKPPIEMVREWTKPVRRITDERALDMLMAPAASGGGTRQIGKKGVWVDGVNYAAIEMIGQEGETVKVLLDPTDLGTIHCYLDDGAYLCAMINPERKGIDRAEFASRLKREQEKIYKAKHAGMKKRSKKEAIENITEEYLSYKEEEAAQVIDLPRPSEEYTTPALAEAAKAGMTDMQRRRIPTGPKMSEEEIKEAKATLIELEGRKKQTDEDPQFFDSDHDHFVHIRNKQNKGTATEYERGWADSYEQCLLQGMPTPAFEVVKNR